MRLGLCLVLVGILLSGCAGAGRSMPVDEKALPLPAVTPKAGGTELPVADEKALVVQATRLAAEQLGVPVANLTFVSTEPVDWPDGSLGCPLPGMVYAQVISPGWRFVFVDSGGETVTLHADRDLQRAVVCDSPAGENAPEAAIADQVRDLLAGQLGVAPDTLTLVSATAREWADASLGCPKPDMMYAQVITPGYQHIFTDQSGREYDVRTGRNPATIVVCEPQLSTPPPAVQPPTNAATQRAIEWLAQQQAIAVDRISVVSVEAVEWPDSCLGCTEPGTYCLMVIVPGYRVVLQVAGTQYEVRTNQDGLNCAMCKP